MKIAVHQPQYLPWLGYFAKIAQVDRFVLLDNVQFKKNEWQNRNRIKTAAGWQWLTVPVIHRFPQRLSEVRIDRTAPWARKHLQALISSYTAAPFFGVHRPFLEELYTREWEWLAELNRVSLAYLIEALGIHTELVLASALGLPKDCVATARLVAISQALGADTYLSGAGGRDYLEVERFEAVGIQVCFQTFQCPRYPQRFGAFVPNLSIIDLLCNCGAASLQILRGEELDARGGITSEAGKDAR